MSVSSLAPQTQHENGAGSSITASRVSVVFRQGHEETIALRDVSLSIAEGEFVSLIGESGCGKTTLLRVIAGLIPPSEGDLDIGGKAVQGPSDEIGFVFQKAVLLDWRKVIENVLLPVEIAGRKTSEYRERGLELLDQLGLSGFSGYYPRQLSGGMQQRVSIARTLIMEPRVLLMDEPFGALDAITREQLNMELLQVWSRQKSTCVFVTHDINEAILLSDRVFLMSRRPGRVHREYRIDLPRPRTLDVRFTPEFTAYARDIKHAMMTNIQSGAG